MQKDLLRPRVRRARRPPRRFAAPRVLGLGPGRRHGGPGLRIRPVQPDRLRQGQRGPGQQRLQGLPARRRGRPPLHLGRRPGLRQEVRRPGPDSVQIQPTLGLKFDLPQGFKLSGAYSQRWRDGEPDLPGVVYERSLTLTHEYYGTFQIGNFLARGWNRPDFPYASDVGQTAFSDSGAAYGILTHAVRYTIAPALGRRRRPRAGGTYDQGDTDFKRNKPQLLEFWALYARGPLMVEAIEQSSRNGPPVAFAKAPFTGLTPFPDRDDQQLERQQPGHVHALGKYQSAPPTRSPAASASTAGAAPTRCRDAGCAGAVEQPLQRRLGRRRRQRRAQPRLLGALDRPDARPAQVRQPEAGGLHRPDLPGQGQHRQPERARAEQFRAVRSASARATTSATACRSQDRRTRWPTAARAWRR